MNKWVEVVIDSVDGETAFARLWPGGVLAKMCNDPYQKIYMPDYRIKMQSGDMDGNRLERVDKSQPEYTVMLRPNNG